MARVHTVYVSHERKGLDVLTLEQLNLRPRYALKLLRSIAERP